MPSPWVRWSCTKCDVGVSLRANSKGGAPWHHCYRQRGKWMPLTKETNDQTNPGGGGPAGSSPGSDARTERSDKRFSSGTVLPDPPVWADLYGSDFTGAVLALFDAIDAAPFDEPSYGFGPGFYDDYHGSDLCRRGTIARAGGFGSYAGFLAFCEWVCGD